MNQQEARQRMNDARCYCGAAAVKFHREVDFSTFRSWDSPESPQYITHGMTLRVTCANGHTVEGYRPERREECAPDFPESRWLGPVVPEVVDEQEYRAAFGEDDEGGGAYDW